MLEAQVLTKTQTEKPESIAQTVPTIGMSGHNVTVRLALSLKSCLCNNCTNAEADEPG